MAQSSASPSSRLASVNRAALVFVGVLSLLGLAYAIARVDILRARIVEVSIALDASREQQAQLQTRFDALSALQQHQANQLAAAEGTLNHLSSGLTTQISRTTEQWARAEVLYLARMAQDQLVHGHDVRNARATLGAAMQRALQQPGALADATQSKLQAALSALQALQPDQTSSIEQRLLAAEQQTATLPLASATVAATTPPAGIWSSIKQAALQLVLVRRSGTQTAQLASAQDAQIQRDYLRQQLLMARVATLRSDSASYLHALGNAATCLQQTFDVGNTAVQSLQHTVSELQGMSVSQPLPDLAPVISLLEATFTKGSAS